MEIPKGGFAIVYDPCGDIQQVIGDNGEPVPGEALPMELKVPARIEKMKCAVSLMYIHQSPGHWVIHDGQKFWVP